MPVSTRHVNEQKNEDDDEVHIWICGAHKYIFNKAPKVQTLSASAH